MKKILFVNSAEKKCGVYQYGARLKHIICNSENMHVDYIEVSNGNEFLAHNFTGIDTVLFNYIDVGPGGPFDWLSNEVVLTLKNKSIKSGRIVHTPHSCVCFDFLIDQEPFALNGIPRPLYTFEPPVPITNEITTIGSFGFQGTRKGFEDIINITNNQYNNAIINFNITNNYYGDQTGAYRDDYISHLRTISLKPGIQLNITTDFLDDNQLLLFLCKNDINLFCYKDNHSTSSVIDYAITANKPIGITNDNSFKHIYTDEINVNKYTIEQIINFCNKNNYVSNFKKIWSKDNLIKKIEQILLALN